MNEQIRYITINRQGQIIGPTSLDKSELKIILVQALNNIGIEGDFEAVKKYGYRIVKASIKILGEGGA